MTEQVMLEPELFVRYAKLLLCIDVEVVRSLFVQKDVFSVEYFEATRYVILL